MRRNTRSCSRWWSCRRDYIFHWQLSALSGVTSGTTDDLLEQLLSQIRMPSLRMSLEPHPIEQFGQVSPPVPILVYAPVQHIIHTSTEPVLESLIHIRQLWMTHATLQSIESNRVDALITLGEIAITTAILSGNIIQ
jgi:hypothetical protein